MKIARLHLIFFSRNRNAVEKAYGFTVQLDIYT